MAKFNFGLASAEFRKNSVWLQPKSNFVTSVHLLCFHTGDRTYRLHFEELLYKVDSELIRPQALLQGDTVWYTNILVGY
jgi:hypothetical protein